MSGPRNQVHWSGSSDKLLDFFDLKGVVEALLARLHLPDLAFAPAEHPTFQTGRGAKLLLGEVEVGAMGEVAPVVRDSFDLPAQRVCLAEFDLDALLAHVPAVSYYESTSRFPAVAQDLALVVDESVPAAQVHAAIVRAAGKLLQRADVFDVYRGDQVPAGKKSLAYALTFQAKDRTLTDDEVNKLKVRIQRALEKELGAKLRS